jgi:hypothetical protein
VQTFVLGHLKREYHVEALKAIEPIFKPINRVVWKVMHLALFLAGYLADNEPCNEDGFLLVNQCQLIKTASQAQ